MKKNLVGALILSLALGAFLSTHAWAGDAGEAAARKDVQSFFDTVAMMFDKKDVEGIVKTVMPGATFRYANGKDITIEEWKATANKEFPNLAKMRSNFKIEKVIVKGDSRIATYKETHDYVQAGEKKNKYRYVGRWSVTLAKTPQGWRAAHFVEFFEKTTRNGKPFTPKAGSNPM